MKIAEIKQQLAGVTDSSSAILVELADDPRVGVQKLILQTKKRLRHEYEQEIAFQKRFKLERALWANGKKIVAGIDEVGRGCLAGPVVTAAVILNDQFNLKQVNDSKQVTAKVRENLYPQIISSAVSVGIGTVSSETIDKIGILNATKQAMVMAIENLEIEPEELLIDAVQVPIDIPKQVMFKGDSTSNSIAAASIVAKEYRDHLMRSYNQTYPGYGFDKNVGYGTKDHLAGLERLGITPIHRKTFEPVPKFI